MISLQPHSKYVKLTTEELLHNLSEFYAALNHSFKPLTENDTMSNNERVKFTSSVVSVNVLFKDINNDMSLINRTRRSCNDEKYRDKRRCNYISMLASSIGAAIPSTITKINEKGNLLARTLRDFTKTDDLPTSIINPLLNEWVLSVAIPALFSIVQIWDLGFKDMLKTMYFSFPDPINPDNKKSLQSFATECRLTTTEREQGMKMFEQGGFLFLINRCVQNSMDEYKNRFALDFSLLKTKILQINFVYNRVMNAFHRAEKKDLCQINSFLNCNNTEHSDSVEYFIDKYNNVRQNINERKLDSSFLAFYEALFKVESGQRTIEWFDDVASMHFDRNSNVYKAIESIKAAREVRNREEIVKVSRRPLRVAAVAASKIVTATAQDEAPSDTESESDSASEESFAPPPSPGDDEVQTLSSNNTPTELTDIESTHCEMKKSTKGSRVVSTKKSQYDVDHVLNKAYQTVNPGEVYFHCPYCDCAKVITSKVKGFDQIKTTTNQFGARPVDQTLEQSICRKMSAWTKMRVHIQQCWMRRRGVHQPDQLNAAKADKLYMERFLPTIFLQKKIKYDKRDTVDATTGKRKFEFYRAQAEKRKKQKWLEEARDLWMNQSS